MYKEFVMFNFIRELFSSNKPVITGKLTIDDRDKIIADLNSSDLIEKVLLSRAAFSDDLALYITFKRPLNVVDETTNENRMDNMAIVLEDESFVFQQNDKLFKITA